MILYLATDLIWATRIKRTAEALGLEARPARDARMLIERLKEGAAGGLLVDLDAGDRAIDLIRAARGHPLGADIRVLCFGPHVRTDLFERARDAGADEAIARGAFDRRIEEVLRSLAGESGG